MPPIGDLGFEQSALAGFQTGQALAGTNPIGVFAKSILERVGKLGEIATEQKLKSTYGDKSLERLFAEKFTEEQAKGQARAPFRKPVRIPNERIESLQQTDTAIRQLEDVIQRQEKHRFQTGPLSLRYQRGPVANFYTQMVATPDEADFKAATERFVNDYNLAQSGVQRGFKEIQWLSTAIPNAAMDDPDNFTQKAYTALMEMKRTRQSMVDWLDAAGYDTEGFKSLIFDRESTRQTPFLQPNDVSDPTQLSEEDLQRIADQL